MAMPKPGAGKAVSQKTSRLATSGRFVTVKTSTKMSASKTAERTPTESRPLAASGLTRTNLTRTVLKKAGGSLIVTVPAGARNALNLSAGQEMTVAVEGERLILEPTAPKRHRPKYSLRELLAQCHPDVPVSDEERRWLDAPAVGRELW